MPKAIQRRKRARARRALWIVALSLPLLAGALVGFNVWLVLHPDQVEAHVRRALDQTLSLPFEIGHVEYTLTEGLVVEDLVVASPPGSRYPHLAEIERARVRIRFLKALLGASPLEFIEIHSPTVYLEQDREGALTLVQMFAAAPERRGERTIDEIPAVELRDLTVHVCSETLVDLAEPLRLPYFNVTLGTRRGQFEFNGSVEHQHVRRIHLRGRGDLREQLITGALEVMGLGVDDELKVRIPGGREFWDRFRPTGLADIELEFQLEAGRLTNYRAEARLLDGTLSLESPPLTIESLGGVVEVTPEGVRTLTPLEGLAWRRPAKLDLTAPFGTDGFTAGEMRLSMLDVPLTRDTRQLFESFEGNASKGVLRAWDLLSPAGHIDIEVAAVGPIAEAEKKQLDVDVTLRLKGVDVRYEHFPYPVRDLRGEVSVKDRTLAFSNLTGGTGDTVVTVDGEVALARTGKVDIHIRHHDFVIDRRIMLARPDILTSFWRSYAPGGEVNTDIWIHRPPEAEDPRDVTAIVTIEGTPDVGASLRYEQFPYPISKVRGQATLKIFRGKLEYVQFDGLHGIHGDASRDEQVSEIRLDRGRVTLLEDKKFDVDLRLTSPRLVVDESLIAACDEETQETIRSFNPNGALAAELTILKPAEEELDVVATLRVRPDSPLRIAYDAFPYPIHLKEGTVLLNFSREYYDFGGFKSDKELGPRLALDGTFQNDPDDPTRKALDLSIDIGPGTIDGEIRPGLPIGDPQLVESLPGDLEEFVRELNLTGHIATRMPVRVYYTYRPGEEGEPLEPRVEYSAELTAHDCAVDFGVTFSDIYANLTVIGSATPESPHSFSCEGTIREHRLSRFRVRDVDFEVTYSEPHRVINEARGGTFVSHNRYAPGMEPARPDGGEAPEGPAAEIEVEEDPLFEIDPILRERLAPNRTRRVLQLYLPSGDLYGGQVEGFMYVDLGAQNDYYADFRTRGIDLSLAAVDVFHTDEEVTGSGQGWVRFWGRSDDPDSLAGRGGMHISDGKLANLGVVAAILQPLRDYDEVKYIERVDAHFTIEANRFFVAPPPDKPSRGETVDQLRLYSRALELHAQPGSFMDFDQNVDFTLVPRFTGSRILFLPIIGQLRAVVERIGHIKVVGPVDDPKLVWPVL